MRRALTISLITMVPAWGLREVLYQHFLFRTGTPLVQLLSSGWELAFLVLGVVLAVFIVLGMYRFGPGRSEYWWLAGAPRVWNPARSAGRIPHSRAVRP